MMMVDAYGNDNDGDDDNGDNGGDASFIDI